MCNHLSKLIKRFRLIARIEIPFSEIFLLIAHGPDLSLGVIILHSIL